MPSVMYHHVLFLITKYLFIRLAERPSPEIVETISFYKWFREKLVRHWDYKLWCMTTFLLWSKGIENEILSLAYMIAIFFVNKCPKSYGYVCELFFVNL